MHFCLDSFSQAMLIILMCSTFIQNITHLKFLHLSQKGFFFFFLIFSHMLLLAAFSLLSSTCLPISPSNVRVSISAAPSVLPSYPAPFCSPLSLFLQHHLFSSCPSIRKFWLNLQPEPAVRSAKDCFHGYRMTCGPSQESMKLDVGWWEGIAHLASQSTLAKPVTSNVTKILNFRLCNATAFVQLSDIQQSYIRAEFASSNCLKLT